ncbi:DUF3575 domain-containing protein [Chitinophaga pinensis]|uniref:DUF3575 domain-containing protein n=1 Tax=Chitinophaga pinensis (strain ATCC 43595 / DSM 2588 / LMG 13176 / NBRC 15968 / NCIMB 11800 / UQM 2034) TaxID=485918 RepID=A0A979GAB2_CHIPD|nr:DUF3575 domain-containing protein [Chitinophaga pinensis]ACU63849.1 hypothetical protein Cpin_6445 [Chitinophaga pinensis DSM 2588]
MKHLYTVFVCLLIAIAAMGQNKKKPEDKGGEPGITTHLVSYAHRTHNDARDEKKARPLPDSILTGWRVSSNLLTLHHPDGGISAAIEYRFRPDWGVLVEGGWIFIDEKKLYDMRGQFTPKAKGYYVRPEIRYYLSGKHGKHRLFFSQDFFYRKVSFYEERIVKMNVDPRDGSADYEQLSTYGKTKEMFGTDSKVGFQTFFGNNHRIVFEAYVGLGLKYRKFTYDRPVPPNSYLEDRNYNFDDAPDRNNIWDGAFPVGLKIGYRF